MITFFGVKDCEKCQAIKFALDERKITYQFYDADADENQDIADTYEVDQLPHVIVTDDAGNILSEYVGDQYSDFIESIDSDKE